MSLEMSERQRNCRVCDSWGCSRCADEPGEQGLSGDETELLRLRDQLRELKAQLDQAKASARAEVRAELLVLVDHVFTVRRRFASGAGDAAEVGIATQHVFDAIRLLEVR
jgi:hypothetical protein